MSDNLIHKHISTYYKYVYVCICTNIYATIKVPRHTHAYNTHTETDMSILYTHTHTHTHIQTMKKTKWLNKRMIWSVTIEREKVKFELSTILKPPNCPKA